MKNYLELSVNLEEFEKPISTRIFITKDVLVGNECVDVLDVMLKRMLHLIEKDYPTLLPNHPSITNNPNHPEYHQMLLSDTKNLSTQDILKDTQDKLKDKFDYLQSKLNIEKE